MQMREAISDIGVGVIGGYVGTKVMEPVSMKLYELESEEDRKREDEVRPGPPYLIAARKITEGLGLDSPRSSSRRSPRTSSTTVWG